MPDGEAMSKVHVVTLYHDWSISVSVFQTAEKALAYAFKFIDECMANVSNEALPEDIGDLDAAISYADDFGALDGRLVQIDECQIDEVAP